MSVGDNIEVRLMRTAPWGRDSETKMIKVLQINLNRCRLVPDLLAQYAWENKMDIVIISEPYRQFGTMIRSGIHCYGSLFLMEDRRLARRRLAREEWLALGSRALRASVDIVPLT